MNEKKAEPVIHLAGCPQERVESYRSARPVGQDVEVTRCIDCGAHSIREVNRGR